MYEAGSGRFHRAVFTLAALAFVTHLLDTLAAGTRPLTMELDAAIVSGVFALVVAGFYRRIPSLPRNAVAVLLGAPWLYGCLHYHVVPTVERGLSPTDLTGIVAAGAAVALLAIGVPPLLQAVRQKPGLPSGASNGTAAPRT